MVAISLVMPCYNRSYDLEHILKAYDQQSTSAAFEIIAVDDASTDGTWKVLSTFAPQNYLLRLFRQEKNQGPAAARNRGIEASTAPLVAFVGDDILPTASFIESHLKIHEQYPDPTLAFLGKVIWAPDLPQNSLMKHIDGIGAQQFSYYYLKDQQEYDYRHFYTANISLKRSILSTVDHYFDTDFPYAAYEDAELSYRLSKYGMRIRYTKSSEGYHYHYHTIWSFATRQYHCGLMARILIQKHPLLIKDVLGSTHRRIIYMVASQLDKTKEKSWLSLEKKAIYLASFYEWKSNQLLDSFYLSLLEYFYCKGVLTGLFSHKSLLNSILNRHACLYLSPLMEQYIRMAKINHVELPCGY